MLTPSLAIIPKKYEQPSLEHALSILGYHLSCLMGVGGLTSEDRASPFGLHFYGDISVKVTVKTADTQDMQWDSVFFDGKFVGNRCGAREEYVRRCAPIVAHIAKREKAA